MHACRSTLEDPTAADLSTRFQPLVNRAIRDLASDGFGSRQRRITRRLDVRYVGQSHEIAVPWSAGYAGAFHRAHARRYGYADPARPTEVVAIRVVASGLTPNVRFPFTKIARRWRPVPEAVRPARFAGRVWRTAFHRWEQLPPGAFGAGPAVIAGGEATVVVPPGFRFSIDGFGNVVLANTNAAGRGGR